MRWRRILVRSTAWGVVIYALFAHGTGGDLGAGVDVVRRFTDLGVDVPVALVHGDADDVVGVGNAHDNFAAANDPKRLVIVPGAGHGDVPELEHDLEELLDWLAGRLR